MPQNKNAFTRIKIIDELLSSHTFYTKQELIQKIVSRMVDLGFYEDERCLNGLSERTLQKDMKFMREVFDAPIQTKKKSIFSSKSGKVENFEVYYYPEGSSFSIFKKELTDEEKSLLGELFGILGNFDGLPFMDGLETLSSELELGTRKNVIELSTGKFSSSSVFGTLFTATTRKIAVELTYHIYSSPEDKKTIIIHPYLIKEYDNRWYIFCAADSDGKLLNFAFDRIDDAKFSEVPFKNCKDNLKHVFQNIVGVSHYPDEKLQKIVFWVSDKQLGYIRSKKIHHSQVEYSGGHDTYFRKKYPELNGGVFFSIVCYDNYELIRDLCSYGPELIVLEPADFRNDKIFDRILKMNEIYLSLRKKSS